MRCMFLELRPGPFGRRSHLLFPKLTKEQEKMLLQQKLKQMEQGPPQKK